MHSRTRASLRNRAFAEARLQQHANSDSTKTAASCSGKNSSFKKPKGLKLLGKPREVCSAEPGAGSPSRGAGKCQAPSTNTLGNPEGTPAREAYLLHLDLQRTWQSVAVLARGPAEWPRLWQRLLSGPGVCWGKPQCDPRASVRTARAETTWQEGVCATETQGARAARDGEGPDSRCSSERGWGSKRAPRSSAWVRGRCTPCDHPRDTKWQRLPRGWGTRRSCVECKWSGREAMSNNQVTRQHRSRWPEAVPAP